MIAAIDIDGTLGGVDDGDVWALVDDPNRTFDDLTPPRAPAGAAARD